MRPKTRRLIFFAPLAILGMVLFAFVGGEIVMHLWNWLVPTIIGGREITFWQALGILVLCRILFGGSGWHRSGSGDYRRRMAERWERMTPEERERARQGWRGRWGFCPPTSESQGQ